MLYIFYGPDSYSKKLHVSRLSSGLSLPVTYIHDFENQDIASFTQGDLFGTARVVIGTCPNLKDMPEELVELCKNSVNHIMLLVDTLDKRLGFTKKILRDAVVVSKEFLLPEGGGLVDWAAARAVDLGGNMPARVTEQMLQRLGVDMGGATWSEQEVSLWQVDSEIQKLVTYAHGEPITAAMVYELVPESVTTQGFDIINALAERNKGKVFSFCERFFSGSGDEKAKFILLTSMLADQFRSMLMVRGFMEEAVHDAEVLRKTGWKSGRLFVVKKIAAKFEQQKIIETLKKLESLDIELKTTSTPPHVLLDLILAQAI